MKADEREFDAIAKAMWLATPDCNGKRRRANDWRGSMPPSQPTWVERQNLWRMAKAAIRWLAEDQDKWSCEGCGRRFKGIAPWSDSEGVELCRKCMPPAGTRRRGRSHANR